MLYEHTRFLSFFHMPLQFACLFKRMYENVYDTSMLHWNVCLEAFESG